MLRALLICWLVIASAFHAASAIASDKTSPPKEEPKKVESQQPQQPPPPAPPKVGRDESSGFMYYTLAGVGTLIVMILLCMPLRRD